MSGHGFVHGDEPTLPRSLLGVRADPSTKTRVRSSHHETVSSGDTRTSLYDPSTFYDARTFYDPMNVVILLQIIWHFISNGIL